jgi:hypothetical protein
MGLVNLGQIDVEPAPDVGREPRSSLIHSVPLSRVRQELGRGYSPRNVGSSTSRSQSPVRLITMDVIMSTTPGQVEIHQAESR